MIVLKQIQDALSISIAFQECFKKLPSRNEADRQAVACVASLLLHSHDDVDGPGSGWGFVRYLPDLRHGLHEDKICILCVN